MLLLLNGCVERGHTVPMKQEKNLITVENNFLKSTIDTDKKYTNKADTPLMSGLNPSKEFDFFNLSESTKNNISGILVLIIGVIILL